MLSKDEVHWFPLRIRNSSLVRLQTLKDRLDQQADIEATYVPLSFIKVSLTKMDFAPFLLNYLFVRTTYEKLLAIKQNQELFEPLRFVMHPALDDDLNKHNEVLFIPDRNMEDYIRVTKEEFSQELCRRMGGAVVSTSANISGQPSPANFSEISDEIRAGVDYIVEYRRAEQTRSVASGIIKLGSGGLVKVIRE